MEVEVCEKPGSLKFYIYCDYGEMDRWFDWAGDISFHVQAPDGEAFIVGQRGSTQHNRMHDEAHRLRMLLLKNGTV